MSPECGTVLGTSTVRGIELREIVYREPVIPRHTHATAGFCVRRQRHLRVRPSVLRAEREGLSALEARWNNGGYVPDFFFERLARRHLEYDAPRYGADESYQRPAILGPKALVINEYAGSGGDSVADYFRKYALGPIVGKRTWGGLMGIGDELPMIDGGRVTVPNISAWDVVNGESVWIVENRGVEPDIEVDQRPDLVVAERDPQLERGLAILNEELKKNPPPKASGRRTARRASSLRTERSVR